jgi:hypothetical protein
MNNPAFSGYICGSTQAADAPVEKPGQGHGRYPAVGRQQFGHGLRTSCKACLDQAWLDYQREIASRHALTSKKTTKVVAAAADHLPLRYMIVYISHIAAPIKPFLSRKGHRAQGAETLHQAWSKAIFWPVALGGGPHGNFDCHC